MSVKNAAVSPIAQALAAVQELGRMTGKPTPTIDTVLALVTRLAKQRGCL